MGHCWHEKPVEASIEVLHLDEGHRVQIAEDQVTKVLNYFEAQWLLLIVLELLLWPHHHFEAGLIIWLYHFEKLKC